MKALLTLAASAALAVPGLPVHAQMQNNTEHQLTCNDRNNDSDYAHHCEMREQSFPSIGQLTVDAGPNGAISIKGAQRGDILVRSRIESQGNTPGDAASISSQIFVDGSGGQVHANGPRSLSGHSGWSVSYEIFVPQTGDVTAKTTNGSVSISDVRGNLQFEVTNGAVHLKRVAGEVGGHTTNGAIQVELAGGNWEGRQMEIATTNGAVTVAMPSHYSAHVQAETNNGRIQSDFPMNVTGEIRPQKIDFNLNAGGPLVHVKTSNGAIRLTKSDAQ